MEKYREHLRIYYFDGSRLALSRMLVGLGERSWE
jgi:hypothetical protein